MITNDIDVSAERIEIDNFYLSFVKIGNKVELYST